MPGDVESQEEPFVRAQLSRTSTWKGRAKDVTQLHEQWQSRQTETFIMLLVDTMYLHKTAFEATDAATVRRAFSLLNKVAHQFHESDCKLPKGKDPLEEHTQKVLHLCAILLSDNEQCQVQGEGDHRDHPYDATALGMDGGLVVWKRDKRQHHLQKLSEVWKHPDFKGVFTFLLKHLGPGRQIKLLLSMCVEVPVDLLSHRQFHHLDANCPVRLVRGNWNGRERLPYYGSHPLDGLADIEPEKTKRAHRYKTRVKVFYTEVKDMLVNRRSKTFNDGVELNFVKCQQAISDSCGQFDYHYVTPFGQALAESNWDLAWPFFCYSRLVDLLFQVLICWYLAPISNDGHQAKVQDYHERIRIPVIVIFLLGSHTALQLLRECINTYCLYMVEEKSVGVLHWLRHNYDFYSVVVVVIEVYSFSFVCELVVDRVVWPWYCHSDESANSMCSAVEWMAGDVLVDTPFRLSMLIFAKWCHLMLSFMNSSVMLETLLPAWKAMTSRYSVAFLVYLLVLSFGTALAYYALPIRIDEESSNPYLEAFFRTSRLNLMGELNTDEFEGGDEGEGPHHNRGRLLSAEHDHPDNPANKYHWALQFFTLGCSVLFPVIALNLYVGMLSHAYEQARRHIVHSRGLLHSASSARAILGNHMGACMSKNCAWHPCNWVYGRTFGWGTSWGETLCGAVWKDGGRDENAAIDETGTWIVIADTEDRDATQIPVELIQDEDMLSLLQNQEDEADVTESDSQALLAKEVAQAMQTLQKLQAKLNSQTKRL